MWALRLLPSRSTFHSSPFTFNFPQEPLFTLHFSLLTSRRDCFSLPEGTAVRRPMQRGAMAGAARCVGTCTVLRFPGERSPFLCKAASVRKHSIPPQPFHPAAGPGKARPQARPCRPTFPSGIQPLPSLSLLEKGAETLLPYRKAGGEDIAGDIRTAWCYSVKGSPAMRTWYRCACDAWQPHRCAGIS